MLHKEIFSYVYVFAWIGFLSIVTLQRISEQSVPPSTNKTYNIRTINKRITNKAYN